MKTSPNRRPCGEKDAPGLSTFFAKIFGSASRQARRANKYFRRGLTAKKRGDLRKAVNMFETALKNAPENADILNNLGVCFSELNQLEAAVDCLKRACELETDVDILANAAVICAHAGDTEASTEYCQVLLQAENVDVETLLFLASTMLGKDSIDLAMSLYETAAERGSQKDKPVQGKGICLARKGDYEEALACVDSLVKEESSRKLGFELKGFILDCQGKYAEAVDSYNQAYGFE